MVGRDKIREFKTYVSGFRWENYEREFRKTSDLKSLYWNVVFLDYLDSTYSSLDETHIKKFSTRLYKSFMGAFFKPHEITAKWESRLEGFSKLYIVENKDEWSSWLEEERNNYNKHFAMVHEIIRRFHEYNLPYESESSTVALNIEQFDSKHRKIEQVISQILLEHIRFTHYINQSRSSELKQFPFNVPKERIDEIHGHAQNYLTSRFTYWFLRNFESHLPSDGPFTLTKSESIEHAFKALLHRYPDFARLDRNTLVEMVELYCQNLEGQKFNKASVRSFLRREGYS